MAKSLGVLFVCAALLAGCQRTDFTAEQECDSLRLQAARSASENKFAEAESLYEQSILSAQKSTNLLQLPTSLDELAELYSQEKKVDLAERTLQRAVLSYREVLKRKLPSDDVSALHRKMKGDLWRLANLLRDQNKNAQAETLYQKALAENARDLETFDNGAEINQDYARLMRKMGRTREAYELEIKAAANNLPQTEWLNETRQVQISLTTKTYDELKKTTDIERKIDILHAAALNYSGKGKLATSYTNLALREIAYSRYKEAEEIVRKAIAIDKVRKNTRQLSTEFSILSYCLKMQDKNKEANDSRTNAIHFLPGEYASVTMYLLTVVQAQGRYDEALRGFRQLLALVGNKKSGAVMSPLQEAETFQKMAESELALGRRKEANADFRKSINLYESQGAEGNYQLAFVCVRLADSLQQTPDLKEAETLYKRVAVLCKQKNWGDRDLCHACSDHYELLLKKLGRFRKADQLPPTTSPR